MNKGLEEFITPTKLQNYILKDPLVDYICLKYNKNKKRISKDYNIFLKKGIEFEELIFKKLKKRFKRNILTVCENYNNIKYSYEEYFNKTLYFIKKKIPIIYQPLLIDYKNKVYGIPDFIVRIDYINKIFKKKIINENISDKYCILDIKWSNLKIGKNDFILNSKRMPFYKSQMIFYNDILSSLQGYSHNYSYILAKNYYLCKNKTNYDSLKMVGKIDIFNRDFKYFKKIEKAKKWFKDLNKNYKNWDPYKNTKIEELYPNMKVINLCDKVNKIKKKISNYKNDLTSLWNVSYKNRKHAHKKNIYSWKNKRCNSINMGIKGDKKKEIINLILKVNRDTKEKILNHKNLDLLNINNSINFYIDFETIIAPLNNIKNDNDTMVFMIGVYDNLNFKSFYINNLNLKEEKNMFKSFDNYIKNKSKGKVPIINYWCNIEKYLTFKKMEKYKIKSFITKNVLWNDLYKVFYNNKIVIKGCLNFKLKDVYNAMVNNNLINPLKGDDNLLQINNGFKAMIISANCYNNKNLDTLEFKSIIEYNKYDCLMIFNIHNFLLKHQIN